MVGHSESRDIRRLDRDECYQLLRRRTLGRVAVRIGADITILPVYYALLDDDVIFRTAPGIKLDAAVLKSRVAFEVDNGNPPWSVLMHGYAEELRDKQLQAQARARLPSDWPAGERERLVRIRVDAISGRRLVPLS
jgi:nitroimidazol reductase NimA-like FMN-containing flavoprotein (pyridoxamine 5'-phosphate oxidase superfamily)